MIRGNPDVARKWKINSKTGRVIPSEHSEQVALMQWAEIASAHRPLLGLLFAIPNGGQRHPAVAAAMKREGVRRGVPDLFLAVGRCGLHGLFIEMKALDGRLSPEQKRWRDLLVAQGYGVAVAFNFDEAKDILERYLDDKWSINEQFTQHRASGDEGGDNVPPEPDAPSLPDRKQRVPSGRVGGLHDNQKRVPVRNRAKSRSSKPSRKLLP